MAKETDLKNERISNFEGLVTFAIV